MKRTYGAGKDGGKEPRDKTIIIRCTEKEKNSIRRRAKKYKLSLSEYSRIQLEKQPVAVVDFSKGAALLANIANNLNQIAKHLNTTGEVRDVETIRRTVASIGKVLPTLAETITLKMEEQQDECI